MNDEFDNNIPIYIQLVERIKREIISGEIKPGERLPSVRDLAINLKVNPNTLQRALSELEDMKLIYTERTNGKYVTSDVKLITKYKEEYATSLINDLIENLKIIGINEEKIINYIKDKGGRL